MEKYVSVGKIISPVVFLTSFVIIIGVNCTRSALAQTAQHSLSKPQIQRLSKSAKFFTEPERSPASDFRFQPADFDQHKESNSHPDAFQLYGFDPSEYRQLAPTSTIGGLPDDFIVRSDGQSVLRIVFTSNSVNISMVQHALLVLKAPSTSKLVPTYKKSVNFENLSFEDSLSLAEQLKPDSQSRTLRYSIFYTDKHHAHSKLKLWGNVYTQQSSNSVMAKLYARAALLAEADDMKHFYSGYSALFKQNWDAAWREFESVYHLNTTSFKNARLIADAYQRIRNRDLDHGIWLSRVMQVAPDWYSFEPAYLERSNIEFKYDLEAAKHEKGVDAPWEANRMPLKVFFRGENELIYDSSLKVTIEDSLRSWIHASKSKITFVETKNPAAADIVCQWAKAPQSYFEYQGLANAPIGAPHQDKLGLTKVMVASGKPYRAEITIYSQGQEQGHGYLYAADDNILTSCCLHEVGHALGISRHLLEMPAIMYFACDISNPLTDLTRADAAKISQLYFNHPQVTNENDTPTSYAVYRPYGCDARDLHSRITNYRDYFFSEIDF